MLVDYLSFSNKSHITGIISSVILVCTYLIFKFQIQKKRIPTQRTNLKKQPPNPEDIFKVTPVDANFDWKTEAPIELYPFKNAEYKLTMGIKSSQVQDWFYVDSEYLAKVEENIKIVTNNHDYYPKEKDLPGRTVFITDECIPAIREFYDIVVNYMCDKYPMIFEKKPLEGLIWNSATGRHVPISAERISTEETRDLLIHLVGVIEEDFIILLKDPSRAHEEDGEEYFFKGGVFAYAAGFNPKERFDQPLLFVHHPVPGYETKLKVSMNRFFNRISPGQFVTRSNFSVQTHDQFYTDDKNKGHNTPEGEEVVPLKMEDLDFEKEVHYRSERQVLTKLPKSGAVVFTIKTYLFPMSQLKAEGREVADRLAGAIRGLPKDIAVYKRAVEWGPAVIQYLEQ